MSFPITRSTPSSSSAFYSCTDIPFSVLEDPSPRRRSRSTLTVSSLLTNSTTGAVSSRTSLPFDPADTSSLRPVDLFGPVPEHVQFPREQAPPGARYCAELDAFVPANMPYRIRGIKKARPKLAKNINGWLKHVGYKVGIRDNQRWIGGRWVYEPLVMAMGLSHAELVLIELREARKRSDIVYRAVRHLGLDLECAKSAEQKK